MSIHLIGGDRAEDYSGEVYSAFIAEATERAALTGRQLARIAVILVGDAEDSPFYAEAYRSQLLRTAPCEPVVTSIAEGDRLPSSVLTDIDGLLIGGGHTPSYLEAVSSVTDEIQVCPEDTGEDLDEVEIVEGLGLVDLAIDVHAAQWGTLSRLIAATEAGLVDGGVAIDEFTVLIVGDGELRVEGSGSVWKVTADDEGVLVGTLGA